jgi:hypothetical protein
MFSFRKRIIPLFKGKPKIASITTPVLTQPKPKTEIPKPPQKSDINLEKSTKKPKEEPKEEPKDKDGLKKGFYIDE